MNRFVFADPNMCIGCRTCEIACALSHQEDGTIAGMGSAEFLPRLTMVKNAKVSTPVMCRQCDDAPCAQVCPNNAIVTENNHIKVIQDRCIGCKTCVMACPYGAMNVVTTISEKTVGPFTQQVVKSEAQKCDLCGDREIGPACVSVCPTGALRLVVPNDLAAMNARKQQASAEAGLNINL
jgi:electron transport protein HydN